MISTFRKYAKQHIEKKYIYRIERSTGGRKIIQAYEDPEEWRDKISFLQKAVSYTLQIVHIFGPLKMQKLDICLKQTVYAS